MSDFKDTNMVVQSNNLIRQTNWELSAVPLKIFKTLVSCIDTKHPPKDNVVVVSKKELHRMVGGEGGDKNHKYLKDCVRSLQRTSVRIVTSPTREVYVSLVNWIEWEKDSDTIRCEFHRELMPHLITLKDFTAYPVGNLLAFNSKYGVIIYEYLKSEMHKTFDPYKNTILIDDLRRLTGTGTKYKKFKDFESRVLKVAKDEINNSNIEFLIDYEKVKVGRTITAIKFKTRSRNTYNENDFNVIKERKKVENPFVESQDTDVAEGQTTIYEF